MSAIVMQATLRWYHWCKRGIHCVETRKQKHFHFTKIFCEVVIIQFEPAYSATGAAWLYHSGTFNNDFGPAYALSYKASRYLALPCLMADLYRGDKSLSMLHLLSGLIPFTLALCGNDNSELGNLMIACNIISLCHYSYEGDSDWGWFTAGAAVFAYFLTPQIGPRVMYPLGLSLIDYCAYRIYNVRSGPSQPRV